VFPDPFVCGGPLGRGASGLEPPQRNAGAKIQYFFKQVKEKREPFLKVID
jgi:hypothetical protein